jgi:hypothetical protein
MKKGQQRQMNKKTTLKLMLSKGHFVRAWSIGLDWRDHNDESTKSAINMQTWF